LINEENISCDWSLKNLPYQRLCSNIAISIKEESKEEEEQQQQQGGQKGQEGQEEN